MGFQGYLLRVVALIPHIESEILYQYSQLRFQTRKSADSCKPRPAAQLSYFLDSDLDSMLELTIWRILSFLILKPEIAAWS